MSAFSLIIIHHTEKSQGIRLRTTQLIHGDQSISEIFRREKRKLCAHNEVQFRPAARSYFQRHRTVQCLHSTKCSQLQCRRWTKPYHTWPRVSLGSPSWFNVCSYQRYSALITSLTVVTVYCFLYFEFFSPLQGIFSVNLWSVLWINKEQLTESFRSTCIQSTQKVKFAWLDSHRTQHATYVTSWQIKYSWSSS